MKKQSEKNDTFEFSFPEMDALVAVENTEDEIVIHTSRSAFSEGRKKAFIRELASEGFICASYLWSGRVRWTVDPAWWDTRPEAKRRTSHILAKLLATSTLFFWLIFMALLFLHKNLKR
jgi:hypothetical protein